MRRNAAIALFAAIALACSAPATSAPTPTPPAVAIPTLAPPSPSAAPSGRPRVSSVLAIGDTITVTFNRPMLWIGEGGGVEMSGNYQLDARALPLVTKIGCQTRDCLVVGIELPGNTLLPGTPHTLRVANVTAQDGPAVDPDPTTVTFTVAPRP